MALNNKALPAVSIIFMVGLTVSGIISYWQYEAKQKVIISEFQKEVDKRGLSLYRELSINFEALRSLAILFHGKEPPEFPVFSQQARKILTRHPNIQALEWIPRIRDQDRALFIDQIAPHFPDFQISARNHEGKMVAASGKEDYFPVFYVEPYKGNEKALGFDLSSSATRLKTLVQSQASGQPLATASITLVQESAKQKGFLAFLPLYPETTRAETINPDNLTGFVLGVYRIGDIFNYSNIDSDAPTIYMQLVDETDAPDILTENKPAVDNPVITDIQYRNELPELWGRHWTLVANPTQRFMSSKQDYFAETLFIIGLMLTLFISWYARLMILHRSMIEGEVETRTRDLIAANEVAENYQQQLIETSKMASLGAMSAGIAHELSQPIGAILLKIQLMLRLLQKPPGEKAIQVLEDMKLQAVRAKKIMDSLRVISREGKDEERSLCHLKAIIEDTLILFNDEFKLGKIKVTTEYDDDCQVLFSPVQLGQIIANLIANARDALAEAPENEKNIIIRTRHQRGSVMLQIEDTGIGIPKENQSKIFEPFFTSKSIGKGTGLGLPMCYSMIQDNHGTIEFHTEQNKGTCFTVKFPEHFSENFSE